MRDHFPSLLAALLSPLLIQTLVAAPEKSVDALQAEFMKLKFGMFIHYNWWDWKKKGTPFLDVALKEMRDISEDNTAVAETCWTLEEKGWFWNPEFKTIDAATVLKYLTTTEPPVYKLKNTYGLPAGGGWAISPSLCEFTYRFVGIVNWS